MYPSAAINFGAQSLPAGVGRPRIHTAPRRSTVREKVRDRERAIARSSRDGSVQPADTPAACAPQIQSGRPLAHAGVKQPVMLRIPTQKMKMRLPALIWLDLALCRRGRGIEMEIERGPAQPPVAFVLP
jgi:hypothetical protein